MANYAYIRIGFYEFAYRYTVPYFWCMLFEQNNLNRRLYKLKSGVYYTISKKKLIERISSLNISIDNVEIQLSLLTGIDSSIWKESRRETLNALSRWEGPVETNNELPSRSFPFLQTDTNENIGNTFEENEEQDEIEDEEEIPDLIE